MERKLIAEPVAAITSLAGPGGRYATSAAEIAADVAHRERLNGSRNVVIGWHALGGGGPDDLVASESLRISAIPIAP
jgi:hypothetical protein